SMGRRPTIVMGTLGGFPSPPAMVRGEQSSPAPHALRASGLSRLRFRSSHTQVCSGAVLGAAAPYAPACRPAGKGGRHGVYLQRASALRIPRRKLHFHSGRICARSIFASYTRCPGGAKAASWAVTIVMSSRALGLLIVLTPPPEQFV